MSLAHSLISAIAVRRAAMAPRMTVPVTTAHGQSESRTSMLFASIPFVSAFVLSPQVTEWPTDAEVVRSAHLSQIANGF